MAFATLADAQALHGAAYVQQCCDRDRDGVVDTTAFIAALESATQLILTYTGGRITIPDPAPPMVVRYTVDLAVYDCSSTRAGLMTEMKKELRANAMKWCADAAKGLVSLGDDQELPTHSAAVEPIAVELEGDNFPFSLRELGKVI